MPGDWGQKRGKLIQVAPSSLVSLPWSKLPEIHGVAWLLSCLVTSEILDQAAFAKDVCKSVGEEVNLHKPCSPERSTMHMWQVLAGENELASLPGGGFQK